jgi:hypothetical protein
MFGQSWAFEHFAFGQQPLRSGVLRRKYLAQILIRLIRNLSRIRDSASHKFEYD